MAARNSFVFMRNFPVLSCKVDEGILTRSDVFGPNGGIIEDVVAYAAPVAKGDLIQLKAESTDKNVIRVKKAVVDAEGRAHGIAVSEPAGIDGVTVSGADPVVAHERIVDVAFFGIGVIELVVSAAGAITPGSSLAIDSAAAAQVQNKNAGDATSLADNGGLMNLTYAAAGETVAVLVGAFQAVAE